MFYASSQKFEEEINKCTDLVRGVCKKYVDFIGI